MRILAIDTACAAVSVAIVDSDAAGPLFARQRAMARGHAEALAPMVEEALAKVESGARSLNRIAATIGPGSFTGIRIGVAMARAMGLALDIPVVGVSTLVAFAAPLLAEARPGVVAAAIDARHGAVYFQLFEPTGRPLIPPRVESPRDAVRAIGAGPARLVGDAARLIAAEAQRGGPAFDVSAATDLPDIVAVARVGLACDPEANPARPLYVKPPDAKPNVADQIARAPA